MNKAILLAIAATGILIVTQNANADHHDHGKKHKGDHAHKMAKGHQGDKMKNKEHGKHKKPDAAPAAPENSAAEPPAEGEPSAE